jgi:hypothetical protein
MEKRYQVFVSSTFWDLEDERQEVMQALLEQDCMPSGMELFPATNDDQWSLIKKVIDDSDYYIVVLAGRYGSIGPTGQSYTEMEYRYALETGKPILGFVHKNIQNIPAKFSETDSAAKEKLAKFHELVKQKLCKLWESPAELGGHVSRSLIKLTKSNPAIGWVRGNMVPTESSVEEILTLRRRIEELERDIASARVTEPDGASDLEKGDDEFEINYTFVGQSYDDYVGVEYGASLFLTWDDIFYCISPLMMDEAHEPALIDALNKKIEQDLKANIHESSELKDLRLSQFKINVDNYQTIKIQLRALGLIVQSDKKKSVKSSVTYWTLTPYGDTVMTRLRAKRKPLKQTVHG